MVSSNQNNGHTSYFASNGNSTTGTNSSGPNSSTSRLTNGASTPNREMSSTTANATAPAKTMSRTSINGLTSTNGSSHGTGISAPSSTTAIEKDQNNVNLAPGMEDTLFSSLKDLFWKISTNKKKSGVIAPVNFINKVKKENGNQLKPFTANKKIETNMWFI
jgi:hypothetical protein